MKDIGRKDKRESTNEKVNALRANLEESGATCDGSPKVSNSSPLVSPTATINMPRGLYNVDVAATFGVPLTTVGDLHLLIKSIEAGKHDELLSEMTNDEHDSTNLNVDESTMPNDPIVQSVDINTKSKSYTEAAGASAKDQPKVKSNIYPGGGLISVFGRKANLVDIVTISIPSLTGDDFTKETIHVVSPPIIATSNAVTPTVEKTMMVSKRWVKRRRGKLLSKLFEDYPEHFVKSDLGSLKFQYLQLSIFISNLSFSTTQTPSNQLGFNSFCKLSAITDMVFLYHTVFALDSQFFM
ncbi:hypothetical protein Tco_0701977 [Tanacetum coccineum]|uniref:Uncharacterized protein n=1 Tax=Tanacetum coccineum TaxID=301880 RepID=A0ABQ4XW99_9ASTR